MPVPAGGEGPSGHHSACASQNSRDEEEAQTTALRYIASLAKYYVDLKELSSDGSQKYVIRADSDDY